MKISYKAAFFVLVMMDLSFHRFVQETTVAGRVNASRFSGFKVALPLYTIMSQKTNSSSFMCMNYTQLRAYNI